MMYYDGIDGTSPIALYRGFIGTKNPTKEAFGMSWNSGIALLDRASFSKWCYDGIREKIVGI